MNITKITIDLRVDITKERERKKKDNKNYACLIKGTSTPSSKASYRKT